MAKKAITITVDEQVILDAKKRAELNNRAFSNHIEWLLIKDIREGEKNNAALPYVNNSVCQDCKGTGRIDHLELGHRVSEICHCNK